MDKLIINGQKNLKGTVKVSAAKNASLPIMAASLLNKGRTTLKNLPDLSDIQFFKKILESLGARVHGNEIICNEITNLKADYELVRKMRASILVLGPMLGRFKEGVVSLPGGCAIGTRPVDLHLKGLEALGAQIEIKSGYIHAKTDGLIGCHIHLDFPSVGATENILMASVYAKGKTRIYNYAKEPEVIDLINFIKKLNANINFNDEYIEVEGTSIIEKNISYNIIGDRIEAATFIIAGVMTKSNIIVEGFNPVHIESVINHLEKMNVKLKVENNLVKILDSNQIIPKSFETQVHPGFPTDVQAQMMALIGSLKGESLVKESIFENRFMHVPELNRMGYDILIEGNRARMNSPHALHGAPVMCTDLRASAALVLAALVSKGESEILRIYHLDRGYVRLEEKLKDLGADIKRIRA